MSKFVFHDIPGLYMAIARWTAGMIYVLALRRRYGKVKTGILSLGFLAVQCVGMALGEDVPDSFRILVTVLSACVMWAMMSVLCKEGKKEIACASMCAFMVAEMTASFEWLLHYYYVYLYEHNSVLFSIGLVASVYGLLFCLVGTVEYRLLQRVDGYHVSWKELAATAGIACLTILMSNLSSVNPKTPFTSVLFYEVFRIRAYVDIMGVLLICILQLWRREQLREEEASAINRVLRSQYEKYIHQQETNELISMKYHDLKHQITALRRENDQEKRQEWLDCMEREIDLYQTIPNTGNQVLDAILENALTAARKHQIEFTYVANGQLLDFMHVTDICTIFGNALDNALEAEVMEPEKKRLVHLSVSSQRKMVYITIENYLCHPENVAVHDLKTTKHDKRYHGYGIKGIRYCVEKYQGNLSIRLRENWFSLSVILPAAEV